MFELVDLGFPAHPSTCPIHRSLHLRLLPSDRCMLIARDRLGDCHIYMSSMANLDDAIAGQRAMKDLKRDKIGENLLFSLDENKRILAVCGTARVSLVFITRQTYLIFV